MRGDLPVACAAAGEYGLGNDGGDLKRGIPSGIKLLSVSVGLLRRIGAANNIGRLRESLCMSSGVFGLAHYPYFAALLRLGRSRGSRRLPKRNEAEKLRREFLCLFRLRASRAGCAFGCVYSRNRSDAFPLPCGRG